MKDHQHGFGLLWAAIALGHFAQIVAKLALPVVATQQSESPIVVGAVVFAFSVPWLVLGLPAGALIDRTDRRRLLIGVTGLRAIALGALAIFALTGVVTSAVLIVVALTLGIGEVFVEPSATVLVPRLVPGRLLDRANARLLTAEMIIELAGQPIAGALLSIGLGIVSGSGALAFAASVSALLLLGGSYRPAAVARRSIGKEIVEGLRFVWRVPVLRAISLMAAVINTCWAAWSAAFVVYVVGSSGLGLSSFTYGLLLAADGAGGLLGALIASRAAGWFGRRWMIGINVACNALLFLSSALTGNVWLLGLAIGLGGIGSPIWGVGVRTLQQQIVPDEVRGRVWSAYRTISFGAEAAGPLIGGLIAVRWGVEPLFFGVGILTLLMFVPFAALVSESRMRPEPSLVQQLEGE